MTRSARRKALLELNDERRRFKQFFHGRSPAHFVLFEKGAFGKAESSHGPLNKALQKRILEANVAGMNVCMAINSSHKGKRVKENFFKVNALFIDKDEGELTAKELRALEPAPHMIVRSSPKKFHAYWLVKDCPVSMFSKLQKALAKRFGTDPSVSDIGRVMRMPGTFHPKYPDQSEPVKIIYLAEQPTALSVEAIIQGLGLTVEGPSSEPSTAPLADTTDVSGAPCPPSASDRSPRTRERVDQALLAIPADVRRTWMCVGMALHSWDPTNSGFETWDAWSSRSPKYEAQTQRATWDGFKAEGGVTLATIFHLASLARVPEEMRVFDEASLAEQFCLLHHEELCYDPKADKWFGFDRTVWEPGAHLPLMAVREMMAALKVANGGSLAKELRGFGVTSGMKAIVNHAQLLPDMHIDASTFDSNPDVLAVKEGVIDLPTGHWRTATPADGMSFRSPVAYDPTATCPIWNRFIKEVVCGNKEYAKYLQRILGYSLFGHAKEQVFFLVIGTGGNGKGVMMRTMKAVLDQYAHTVAPNVLSRAYSGNPNSPSPALSPLQRARFVACTELSGGGLDEAFVKQFAGGDQLSARPNYGELVTFTPPGKLWLSTNKMPEIEAGDQAMWRRLVPLPFTASFRGKNADTDLEAKLEKEHPGILMWLLRGAAEYAADGLGECQVVTDCRKELMASADSVQAWIDEHGRADRDARIPAGEAYESYARYTRGAKRKPLTNKEFPQRMEKKGFVHKRRNSGSFFEGLRLVTPPPFRRNG